MRGQVKFINIVKWSLIVLVTIFFLLTMSLYLLDKYVVHSSYRAANISVLNTGSADQSEQGFINRLTLENLMQSKIDPDYQKSIGVIPGSRWYNLKIFTENLQITIGLEKNKNFGQAVFCKRRLEEFIILNQNQDFDNADKVLTLYISEIKKFDKASLNKLPKDDKTKIELGKSFAIIEILSQNQNVSSLDKFIEAKRFSEAIWKY